MLSRAPAGAFALESSMKHNDKSIVLISLQIFFAVNWALPVRAENDNASAKRIVSLAPSNTELLYSLGAEKQLVGISNFCTYPPQTKSKQKVGSFISVNWERLATIKPDLVLLVSGQEQLAIQLKKHKVNSIILNNNSLDDIAKNLLVLGTICQRQPAAERLAANYRTSVTELRNILKSEQKRKVFFCVWPKPIVTVGGTSFLNDVITTCGGINVASHVRSSYPKYSAEKVIGAQPDIIVMPFESRDTNLKKVAPWSLLSAFRNGKVYFLPDREHDYLSRPTLRIYGGLCQLAAQIHPSQSTKLAKWLANAEAGNRSTAVKDQKQWD